MKTFATSTSKDLKIEEKFEKFEELEIENVTNLISGGRDTKLEVFLEIALSI